MRSWTSTLARRLREWDEQRRDFGPRSLHLQELVGQIAWVHTGVTHGVKGAKKQTSRQELDVTIYHEVMHQAGAWVNYISHSCMPLMQCNSCCTRSSCNHDIVTDRLPV